MKKLILLLLATVIIAGCRNVKNEDGTFSLVKEPRIYTIDSCEYIGYLGFGDADVLAHKGNCKFCAERKKKELEELVIKIKENNYDNN